MDIFNRSKSFIRKRIINLKKYIYDIAFKKSFSIQKLNSKFELESFISRFRENYISCDLIRVGGDRDGGYLLPNNLNNISFCFSPGVAQTALFEKELSDKYNIKSFMIDASVNSCPISGFNFEFLPKFLGTQTKNEFITLTDWISETIGEDNSGKILQMDIEESEYDVLIFEDSKTLSSFSTIIIEFHSLHKLFERSFLNMFSAIFEKLFKYFSICHVHPNNDAGLIELDGISVPKMMEVTFIRNDLLKKYANNEKIHLPHVLDRKNILNKKEIIMPKIWWSKDL